MQIKDEGISQYVCPLCHQQLHFISSQAWADLYFISLFPIQKKIFHFGCVHCGSNYPVPGTIDVEAILKEEAAKIPLTKFQLFKQKIWKVIKHPAVWGTPLAALALKITFDKSYQKYLERPWGYAAWSQEAKIAHVKKILMHHHNYHRDSYSSKEADNTIKNYLKNHSFPMDNTNPMETTRAVYFKS